MDSFALIIFGITSNLAQIKLIPTLLDMETKGLLPANTTIIGAARKPLTTREFDQYIGTITDQKSRKHHHTHTAGTIKSLLKKMIYLHGDLDDSHFYQKLSDLLIKRGRKCDNRIFYLATYPNLYASVFRHMSEHNLNKSDCGWTRLMIEKPLGSDLPSAQKLNQLLSTYFDEDQVYRLDHYLGKDTLQNILTFRFGNGIFEPMMNKEHIDHIQITAAENFGIGERAGYYDTTGALKDVGQNHLLQMLAFATMDAPAEFSNQAVTRERHRVFKRLQPGPLVLGQYAGYKHEKGISPDSRTDTFFAFKTSLGNDRFSGVPIYVRAGKKLEQTATEISIVFKTPLNRLFKQLPDGEEPNVLIYRIHPNEAVVLRILVKKPGHVVAVEPTYMQFCYRELASDLPESYEKLFYDAMRGDQTFFTDAAEVETEWAFIDTLLKNKPAVHQYAPGSWGPRAADDLINVDGRSWLAPSMAFCNI